MINICVEKCMWLVAIVAPLSTIPQILDIYTTHRVMGISLLTWIMYALIPIFWLVYGVAHKDKYIMINNVLWFIVSSVVVVGILVFR